MRNPGLLQKPIAATGAAILVALAGGLAAGALTRDALAQPAASPCDLQVDKVAGPPVVLLGDPVTVTLSVGGRCPQEAAAIDVMLVIDQSDSMSNDDKMENAQAAAIAFLDEVDLTRSRVGIVAFNHVAGLRQELTQNRASVESAIDGLRPGGQTNVSAAISLAHTHLMEQSAGAPRAMIVLTDGYNTAPGAEPIGVAAARAHADAVAVAAICAGGDCDPELPDAASEPGLYYDVPDTSQLPELYRALAGELSANAIATLTIRDELPSDMVYVTGSASPAAAREGPGFLEWDFAGLPPDEITYLVLPQRVGRHPTNVVARATFEDRLGGEGSATFPVPAVRVIASPDCITEPLEVMFLIDDSNCLYGQTLNDMDARSAIKLGIEAVLADLDPAVDQAAVIGFGDRAITFQSLTHDKGLILDAVDRVAMRDSQARLDYGFQAVAREMQGPSHDPMANVVTIIVTDGPMMQAPELAELQGLALQRMGVRHYSIGVGFVTQHAVLRTLSEPGGYYEIPFGGDVITPYTQIGATVATLGQDCSPAAPTATPWNPPVPEGVLYLPRTVFHSQ